MNRKILISLFAIIAIVIIGILWYFDSTAEEGMTISTTDSMLKIVIYPTGGNSDTYLFSLDNNNNLTCWFGERAGTNMEEQIQLEKVSESGEKKLSKFETERILRLADELTQTAFTPENLDVSDSWEITLYYGNANYTTNYWVYNTNESKILIDLVDIVVELSPISVDLHGWA